MKKAILGKKLGMTQMFAKDGTMVPITVIQAGPCPVVQVKTAEHDGYASVQVGFAPVREKLLTKPQLGHHWQGRHRPAPLSQGIKAGRLRRLRGRTGYNSR